MRRRELILLPEQNLIKQMLHVNVGRYLVLYLNRMAFQMQSQAEHYALLTACQAGDLSHAKTLLMAHLQAADALIRMWKRFAYRDKISITISTTAGPHRWCRAHEY